MPEKIEGNDFKPGTMNQEEFIRSYLNGRLNETEMAEYQRLLETDPEFRKEVGFQKDLKTAFSKLNSERIKTKLKKFEDEFTPSKRNHLTIWLVAASVLIIIGTGFITFFNNPTSPDKLYLAYFKPYENVVAPITRGQSTEALKTEIFLAYEKENYEKAAEGFNRLYESTNETYYLLYEANALMAKGKVKKAIPLLQKQLNFQDDFAEKTRWYLGLAYLETNQVKKAKKLLQEIVAAKSYNAKKAETILEKLE